MAEVSFERVTKRFDGTTAVDDLTLEVHDGEFLVLLGPSGCGKSTALRMVAGLEEISSGEIAIGSTIVNDLTTQSRDVAMVFQSYALYPHMTVARNILFPLRQVRMTKQERLAKVDAIATSLGLKDLLDRKPRQLSGGQRQRVALARAIVRQPQVFLMDEPLSNLDAALRVQTRSDIVKLQHEIGTTTLYVTHDQIEAMTMGHRIAVLYAGRLQQVGAPYDLYRRPANTFVAGFLGSPGMNLLAATSTDGSLLVDGTPLGITADVHDGPLIVGARAEQVRLAADGLAGLATAVEVLGADVLVLASLRDGTVVAVRQPIEAPRPSIGEPVSVELTHGEYALFDAATTMLMDPVAT